MTALLTEWLRPLIGGALLIALILALAPEGKHRASLKFASGVLMTLLLLRPLTGLDPAGLAAQLSSGQLQTEEIRDAEAQQAAAVYDLFIRRETEEYIWSAAKELGIETLGVRVVLNADAEALCPWEVFLRGSCTEEQRLALSRLLETELGVPAQRQHWSGLYAD